MAKQWASTGPIAVETTPTPDSVLNLGKGVSLVFWDTSLIVKDRAQAKRHRNKSCGFTAGSSPNQLAIPFYNILWAEATSTATDSQPGGGSITIDYALPTSPKHVRPEKLTYPLGADVPLQDATKWVETLLDKAYGPGVQRRKRAKAIVNPHAGPGGADKIWDRDVRPLFEAARMTLDVTRTSITKEAITICEQLDLSAFDVVIPCSGDGLPFECFNGLGNRPDARKALSELAVAHIPCGSGNGMSCNLYGSPPCPSLAALSIIKGVRAKMDLMSVTQGDKRMLSFLSQSLGIIAESDLGTEHLRWMGAKRFDVGVVQRIFSKKVYPCEVAAKVEIADKQAIKAHFKRIRAQEDEEASKDGSSGRKVLQEDWEGEGLPPLKYGTINDKVPEDWEKTTYDNMGNFYNGNMAWMAPAANFFPAACINDGLMDLVYNDGNLSAAKYIGLMTAVESGKFFDNPNMTYRKISAYRITPIRQTGTSAGGEGGYISIDGEKVPFAPFQVEIHPGLATVLCKSGRFETPGPMGWEKA
ncbi:diacylglycerol kinase catalytic domain-containing protein [Microdochium bolleyi]|uniref:Diacylglycerol kinase catalytic domain-containing protein n=1 Tax=Microdochium bolleyi TaxID=196109 RepID=A0A136J371_9PEZI|nr:diacylglycerol kinase catalytic domain-containing protein [Microdochium bolleyi]